MPGDGDVGLELGKPLLPDGLGAVTRFGEYSDGG